MKEEARATSANAAVPDEAAGWWVLHPLESVLWTYAAALPVSVCVRLSGANASRPGIMYAIDGVSSLNVGGSGRTVLTVQAVRSGQL